MPLLCHRTPDLHRLSQEPLLPHASLSLSSTVRYPRPSRPDWMLRPPRPPPVSRRSRGLWTVARGSFSLPPTWPSSPALHARDRRRLLQKLPHCQPALAAASFHRGWRITRSPACPSAGADDPGWNLNSPAPAPIHNPRGRLPLHAAPAPALVPARWPCDVSVARCSSATQTVPRAPRTSWLQERGMGPPPGGWAGEESLAYHSKSQWERRSPPLSCCTKDSLRD